MQPVPTCQLQHVIHRGESPLQVHRHDRLRPIRDGGLDAGRIDVARLIVDVDRHRRRTGGAHCEPGRDEREPRDDHLVSRPMSSARSASTRASSPVLTTIAWSVPQYLGELALERLGLLPEQEPPAVEHAPIGVVEGVAGFCDCRPQIEER